MAMPVETKGLGRERREARYMESSVLNSGDGGAVLVKRVSIPEGRGARTRKDNQRSA